MQALLGWLQARCLLSCILRMFKVSGCSKLLQQIAAANVRFHDSTKHDLHHEKVEENEHLNYMFPYWVFEKPRMLKWDWHTQPRLEIRSNLPGVSSNSPWMAHRKSTTSHLPPVISFFFEILLAERWHLATSGWWSEISRAKNPLCVIVYLYTQAKLTPMSLGRYPTS